MLAPQEAASENWSNDSNKPGGYDDDFAYGATVSACSVSVRHGFIRKVYGILSAQLLCTLVFIAAVCSSAANKSWIQHQQGLLWTCVALSLVFVLTLACVPAARDSYPANMFLLGAFTLVESYILAFISSTYSADSVLQAVFITTLVVVGLTLYTFQTKYDWSGMGTGLFVFLMIFCLFGLMRMFFPHSALVDTVYATIGALLFSVYLIYDTYLIIHKLSPDQYIMAALNIYLDIINLFLYILEIIGKRE